MGKFDKLVEKLLHGASGANFTFDDLRYVLLRLGFEERIHGSHHVYRNAAMKLVLQPDGKDAKRYQVAQVRAVVAVLNPTGQEDDDGQV